jgi:gas vesicle protein
MDEKIVKRVSYMLVGLGIGSLIGTLFAPKSGEETREYLTDTAKEASEYAQTQAREIKGRAEDLIERGKEVVAQKKEQIAAAVNAGLEVYHQEQLMGRSRGRNQLESRVGFQAS